MGRIRIKFESYERKKKLFINGVETLVSDNVNEVVTEIL